MKIIEKDVGGLLRFSTLHKFRESSQKEGIFRDRAQTTYPVLGQF